MATTAYRQHYALPRQGTLPISMPRKATRDPYQGKSVAMSPPEASEYSSSRSSGPSYSARSSTYARSDYDGESSNSYSGVDVMDSLSDRMNRAFDPITMDKNLARQSQTSGRLNAKQRELLELQASAQRRIKNSRAKYAEGIQAAKDTRRNLEYISSETASMKSRASSSQPDAYARAASKYGPKGR